VNDDIVSRLWQYTPEAPNTPMETRLLLNDAANEILRLRAEVARLGTFLHPVGMVINTYGTSPTITESQMQKLKEEPS
jgi:hypothetical protein